MTNSTKEKALASIVDLVRTHNISIDEITARIIKDLPKSDEGHSNILTRILVYIGGLFIFAGIAAYVGMIWDDLNSPARVIITLGPGLIALILGIATAKDERYMKAATPCFLIAALLEPTGFFVYLNEYFEGDNAALAATIVFGPLMLQMGLVFWKLRRTSLLFFTLTFAFAFFWAVLDLFELNEDIIAFILGLSGLLVTQAINKTPHRAFVPFTYFIFALCMAGGIFEILEDIPPLDFALIGVAGGMIYASVLAQSRSFLVASVITMLAYLAYYTNEYFADIVSWPIALIVMGMIMIGLSSYAIKLGRKIRTAG